MITASQPMDGAVLHLLLNRPKANLLDAAMIRGIVEAIERELTADIRLIVFEGAGDHFCFGASVEEHQSDGAAEMLAAFHGLFRMLARIAVPTCAVVRGQCLGGGLELASWCTWIVATPDARLGQPEIKLAVFPPMASLLLPWRIGGPAGLDLCVTGRSVGAEEALSMGLVSAVSEEPEAWWMTLVSKRLAATSASSLRFAERAARLTLTQQLDTLLPELERLYLSELMLSHDANEGVEAFLEHRPPTFTNA